MWRSFFLFFYWHLLWSSLRLLSRCARRNWLLGRLWSGCFRSGLFFKRLKRWQNGAQRKLSALLLLEFFNSGRLVDLDGDIEAGTFERDILRESVMCAQSRELERLCLEVVLSEELFLLQTEIYFLFFQSLE